MILSLLKLYIIYYIPTFFITRWPPIHWREWLLSLMQLATFSNVYLSLDFQSSSSVNIVFFHHIIAHFSFTGVYLLILGFHSRNLTLWLNIIAWHTGNKISTQTGIGTAIAIAGVALYSFIKARIEEEKRVSLVSIWFLYHNCIAK